LLLKDEEDVGLISETVDRSTGLLDEKNFSFALL
jgi:hypothetical protein